MVCQLVGYDRLEGQRAYRQLAELYRAVRLYVNFFQPSMKLVTKNADWQSCAANVRTGADAVPAVAGEWRA